jgi:hypothetical protein
MERRVRLLVASEVNNVIVDRLERSRYCLSLMERRCRYCLSLMERKGELCLS